MFKIMTIITFFILQMLTANAKERLVVTGSSTIAPVLSDLAKIYERDHKGTRIDVQTGGSSRGVIDIRKNLSQIGMVSRALKEKEKNLHAFLFAKDGISIILHKSNPIKNLTKKQVQKIYLGEINNWKELGGLDQKIVVINKSEGRATLELFLKYFKLKNSKIDAQIIIGDNEQGIKSVSTNSSSIAYVSIGAAIYNASIGVPIKLPTFEGVKAKVENISNGTYPLMRELNLITKIKPTGVVKNFIEFIQSPKASVTIREYFFVPTH